MSSALPPGAPDRGFVIVMTACIAPKAGAREHLRRADPAVRLRDYEAALRFWLTLREPRITGIIFADNSGHPLDSLQQVAAGFPAAPPVEFLSFDSPPPPEGLNYGYTEFLLVNDALARSRLAASARYFIKVTGRYRFPDLPRLLRRLPRDFRVAIDCRGGRPSGRLKQPMASTPLAIFDRVFYLESLAALPHRMVPAPPWDGRLHYIEFMLFDALYPRRTEPGIILRWPCNCEAHGIGANGDDYMTPRKRIQHAVRAVCRVLRPSLWI